LIATELRRKHLAVATMIGLMIDMSINCHVKFIWNAFNLIEIEHLRCRLMNLGMNVVKKMLSCVKFGMWKHDDSGRGLSIWNLWCQDVVMRIVVISCDMMHWCINCAISINDMMVRWRTEVWQSLAVRSASGLARSNPTCHVVRDFTSEKQGFDLNTGILAVRPCFQRPLTPVLAQKNT
jgi:hypothetical protein